MCFTSLPIPNFPLQRDRPGDNRRHAVWRAGRDHPGEASRKAEYYPNPALQMTSSWDRRGLARSSENDQPDRQNAQPDSQPLIAGDLLF